jgi:hypothetical protein
MNLEGYLNPRFFFQGYIGSYWLKEALLHKEARLRRFASDLSSRTEESAGGRC